MSGYAQPRALASGGEAAFGRLRMAYPLVLLAAQLCLAGAVASVRPAWRLRGAHRRAACAAAVAALLAVVLFAGTVGDALAALQGVSMGTGGSLGTMQALRGGAAVLAVCLSPGPERSPGREPVAGVSPGGPRVPAGVQPAA